MLRESLWEGWRKEGKREGHSPPRLALAPYPLQCAGDGVGVWTPS